MYGYDLPAYVREYVRQWQQYDRFLRARRSLDVPGSYVVERKTRYIAGLPFTRGTDRQVQLKDGYRTIMRVWPRELRDVLGSLRLTDIQARGGAKVLANALDAIDTANWESEDRRRLSELEARSSDAYDTLAWSEGRRVSFRGTNR